jgi:hypothetical protein
MDFEKRPRTSWTRRSYTRRSQALAEKSQVRPAGCDVRKKNEAIVALELTLQRPLSLDVSSEYAFLVPSQRSCGLDPNFRTRSRCSICSHPSCTEPVARCGWLGGDRSESFRFSRPCCKHAWRHYMRSAIQRTLSLASLLKIDACRPVPDGYLRAAPTEPGAPAPSEPGGLSLCVWWMNAAEPVGDRVRRWRREKRRFSCFTPSFFAKKTRTMYRAMAFHLITVSSRFERVDNDESGR